jgi:sulfate transport system ATP-binding protein
MNQGKIEQVGAPAEVYHHPASPFVYQFLGNVNLFHGRIVDGHVTIDGAPADAGDPHHRNGATQKPATVYVRPHQLDLALEPNGGSEFRATVVHVNSAGPKVKVELITEWNDPVFAEIDHERFNELQLKKGQRVFARPREKPTVFEYQI